MQIVSEMHSKALSLFALSSRFVMLFRLRFSSRDALLCVLNLQLDSSDDVSP